MFTLAEKTMIAMLCILVAIVTYQIKRENVYEEKCIHGYIILVGHSGGIAGPLGECE